MSKFDSNKKNSRSLIDILVVPIDACPYRILMVIDEWAGVISVPFQTWIFYTRVRAAYHNSRLMRWSFFALWMTTLTALGVPLTVKLTSTPLGIDLCVISYVFHLPIMIGYLIVLAFFDMAVFVAISVRIMSPNPSSSLRSRISCWMLGDKMGHISRLFLRSSQIYYL